MGGSYSSRWHGYDRRRCIGEETIQLAMSVLVQLANAPTGTRATLAWGERGERLKFRASIRNSREQPDNGAVARQLDLSTLGDRKRLGAIGLKGYCAPYGGVRWWLSCPNCGRNRRALYCFKERIELPGSQLPFECRECAGLAYRLQRLVLRDRLESRCCKIAARMGHGETWYPDNRGSPPKPKRMHYSTWHRCNQQLDALEARQHEVWMGEWRTVFDAIYRRAGNR